MQLNQPIFFAPNRVWRCYTGGALLDRFVGAPRETDGHVPEDWLASTVRAINDEHSQGPDEGLTRTIEADGRPGPLLADLLAEHAAEILGPAHAARYGPNTAVLCKYLDSAVRLPIQCHPDVPLARRLLNSSFGKTECWHVLDCRPIGGQAPYLLMGFKPGVTRRTFGDAVMREDIAAMESMLHKLPARPGQTCFVPGRLPHAIGPGVFMIEVQEPSDWVVQPERYCADTRLSDANMWGPLKPEVGLDVFDYAGRTEDELLQHVVRTETVLQSEPGGTVGEIIGPRDTPAFSLWQAHVTGKLRIRFPRPFAIVIVTGGAGTIAWDGGSRVVRRGEYFLQPFGVEWLDYTARGELTLVAGLPPEAA